MSTDIVLEVLLGLSEADKVEVSELSRPLVGDAVFSHSRDLEGKYGGGEIVSVDHDEDEYTVAWWDPAKDGYQFDCTIYEKLDFTHYSDGKAGRTWFAG
jgi:hypothetical protein